MGYDSFNDCSISNRLIDGVVQMGYYLRFMIIRIQIGKEVKIFKNGFLSNLSLILPKLIIFLILNNGLLIFPTKHHFLQKPAWSVFPATNIWTISGD